MKIAVTGASGFIGGRFVELKKIFQNHLKEN
jgi:dTDP-D-glucose 4,6-dehydratase